MQRALTRRQARETGHAAQVQAPAPGLSLHQIADRNARVVLETIRQEGALTRSELAKRVQLTIPSVTTIVKRLVDDGLLAETPRAAKSTRRSSMEFALNPDGAFAIGLRVRRGRGQAVLVDLAGTIRESIAFAADDFVAACAGAVAALGETAGTGTIVGVGVATDEGRSADVMGLQQRLEPLPVATERESVTLALAEQPAGGSGGDSIVVMTVGRTVRAGLCLDGVAFGGVHGRAGRIGHMLTGPDRVPLDSVASIASLERFLGEAMPGNAALEDPARPIRDAGTDALLDSWVSIAANHLLDAIVALSGFTGPQQVLIGGDLPEDLIDRLIAQIETDRQGSARRPIPPPWLPQIRRAAHPRDGAVLGAALAVLYDTVLTHPSATRGG